MTPYRALIERIAAAYGLNANLVEALVIQESQGCADAFRFEQGFFRRYLRDDPRYRSLVPRRISSSYGLMQVMYTTALELGFTGDPELLFLPEKSLTYGCQLLAKCLEDAVGDERQALATYNGGTHWQDAGPQRYADAVLRLKATVEAAHVG